MVWKTLCRNFRRVGHIHIWNFGRKITNLGWEKWRVDISEGVWAIWYSYFGIWVTKRMCLGNIGWENIWWTFQKGVWAICLACLFWLFWINVQKKKPVDLTRVWAFIVIIWLIWCYLAVSFRYVLIAQNILEENSLSQDQFATEILPVLMTLSVDPIPNVRIALSRTLAKFVIHSGVWKFHITPSSCG